MCLGKTAAVLLFLVFLHGATNKDLQIVWMVPQNFSEYNVTSSVGALAMAFKRIQTEELLPVYDHFNITWLDTACSSQKSIGHLTDHLITHRTPDVIFGPPCSEAMVPVADVAAYYNVPIFSWVTRQHVVDNKTKYSTLVRSRPPISSLVEMFYEISFKFEWRLAVMLYTGDVVSTRAVAEAMIAKFLLDRHFSLVKQFVIMSDAPNEELDPMLLSIKRIARIVFLIIPQSELRRYMLKFHDFGMTNGDYQYLFTELDVTSLAVLKKGLLWRGHDGRDVAAHQAFENVLIFTFIDILYNRPNMAMAQEAYEELFQNSTLPRPMEVNEFEQPDGHSTFLYDAVMLFAIAMNETLEANRSSTGKELFQACIYKNFTGLSGPVFMNNVSDRSPGFVVWDLGMDGNFQIALILNYKPINTSSGITAMREVHMYLDVIWGDGQTSRVHVPPDRPECGFYDELCKDNTRTLLLSTLVSAALVISLTGVLCVIRWWRKEREIHLMAWKINYSELDFNFKQKQAKSMSNFTSVLNVFGSHESIGSGSALSSYGSVMGCSALLSRKISLAIYRNAMVVVKNIRKSKISIDRDMMMHMRELFSIKHANLATFIGMCTEIDKVAVVWGFCSKGSLQDIVENANMKIDGAFQFSIAIDICMGLMYLHSGTLKLHGNLKSTNCVVDNHWVCKLTDFGMRPIRQGEPQKTDVGEEEYYSDLFWMAPELLREHLLSSTYVPTQNGDVFALGVILKEVLCLNRPYTNDFTPKEIIQAVAHPVDKLTRPSIHDVHDEYYSIRLSFKKLIQICWTEDPDERPTAKLVLKTLKRLSPYRSTTVLDNMVMMMERYSNRLEEIVADRTSQLEEEKRKTDQLLYKMLPKTVADVLKSGNHVKAEYYESVTVFFSDIVGFTDLAAESSPLEIVEFLNSLYSSFDDIIQRFDVYKVETIGDAYMVASGLPIRNGDRHVTEMADMALSLVHCVREFEIPHRPDRQLQIRAGLHTGSVVAGVVGLTMPRYCLFGDTVNTASRMESNGKPQLIHISPDTEKVLHETAKYQIKQRGQVLIKGKGLMETFWLLGKEGLFDISNAAAEDGICVVHRCDASRTSGRRPYDDVVGDNEKCSLKL